MLVSTRQEAILKDIQSNRSIQVEAMARKFGVSASTIRRDLAWLGRTHGIARVYGGAIAAGDEAQAPVDAPRSQRSRQHADEKRRIGAAAAELVSDKQTVLLLGGTTTEAMVPFLSDRSRLTVITNSIRIAHRLAELTQATVVVLGGYLRRGAEMQLLGHLAVEALRHLAVDLAFYGAYAIGGEGVMGVDVMEADTDRALLAATARIVILADASKFSRRGPTLLVPAADIDTIVTDEATPSSKLTRLESLGIQVITAGSL